jgi:2-keto-4-pentenoate hydratase/2-oxohepta-3-ene-1,7-dioic acid hydratase in catechol pathway
MAPVRGMEKVLCIGMNYVDHCTEQDYPIPTEPIVFNKCPQTISNPGDVIQQPPIVKNLDFEVELAIVIGKGGKNIPQNKANDHIFGYTVAHDVSARHWQLKRNGAQWFCGKTFDTFSPIGPAIVTRDAMDPNTQPIKCFLNGEVVQSSNTDQLIFRCDFLVSWCSQFMTLKPGDLIFTGTPPGVGCFRKPPLWLKPGDEVTCEIGQIGAITNAVVAHAPVYESFEPPACSSMDTLSRRVLNLETRMRAFDAGGSVSESADLVIDTMQAAELRSEVRKLQHRLDVTLKALETAGAKL